LHRGKCNGGIDLEREIVNLIEKRANTPAITTATAVKASFDALKVKKIAIATPYYKATNQCEKEGFERQGYHVTKIMGYHESAPPRSFKKRGSVDFSPKSLTEWDWRLMEKKMRLSLSVAGISRQSRLSKNWKKRQESQSFPAIRL
jgi:hypothetical protein